MAVKVKNRSRRPIIINASQYDDNGQKERNSFISFEPDTVTEIPNKIWKDIKDKKSVKSRLQGEHGGPGKFVIVNDDSDDDGE